MSMSSAAASCIRMSAGCWILPAPRLFGRHQFGNAGLGDRDAARAGYLQDRSCAPLKPVSRAPNWPARMQRLTSGRLVALAPADSEVWLDGGHNADGGRVIAAALGDLEERVPRPLVVIAGMMANKDATGFLANFAGQTRHIIAVKIPGRDGAMAPEALGRRRAESRHARRDGAERRRCAAIPH